MVNDHFADVDKKGTMSLTLALIILDRLNTTERIDVAQDNLVEAVQVVSAAAKYRIPQKPEKSISYWATSKAKTCPTCKYGVLFGNPKFCSHCGQALDWRCHNERSTTDLLQVLKRLSAQLTAPRTT